LHQFPKYGKISISTNILGDENQFLRFVMPWYKKTAKPALRSENLWLNHILCIWHPFAKGDTLNKTFSLARREVSLEMPGAERYTAHFSRLNGNLISSLGNSTSKIGEVSLRIARKHFFNDESNLWL
jgi:hypothetical protein